MKYALAIDIGASSGRHIIGWKDHDGKSERTIITQPGMRYEGLVGYNGMTFSGWYAPGVNIHRFPLSGWPEL